MPELTIVTRDGGEHHVPGEADLSVMEIIRGNGFGELLALCGGSCSCATCHVYVETAAVSRLPPTGADEDDLLDFDEDLAGLHVTIAPAE